MSKRGPGSELNHENWDEDEESEQAGVFSKAPDKEIQGRVIKKARRRNPGDAGENRNAFASFGGFSATKPAGDGFSFLSSSSAAAAETKPASFVFGSSNGEAAKPSAFPTFGAASFTPSGNVKPSFVFGKTPEEKKEEPPKTFPLSPTTENKSTEPGRQNDLMAMFKPQVGTWSCGICMISNPGEKTKCAACETPKPGAKQPETNGFKPAFGDSGGFSFGTNDSSAKSSGFSFGASSASSGFASSASSGFTFGATASKKHETSTVETFSFGGSSSDKKEEPKAAPVASFVFGSAPAEKSSSSPFSFGSKSSVFTLPAFSGAAGATDKTEKSTFAFGSAKAETPEQPQQKKVGFSFGAKKDDSSSSESTSGSKPGFAAFSFGAKPPESDSKTELNGKANSDFTFGRKEADKCETTSFGSRKSFGGGSNEQKSTETYNSVATAKEANHVENTSVVEYDEKYLAHLKALNLQVTEWIKKHIEENPLVILSPVFQDYEKHLKEITEKNPPKPAALAVARKSLPPQGSSSFPLQTNNVSSPAKVSEAVKPFSFGAKLENKQDSTSSGFTFGSAVTGSKPGGGFSFGSTGSTGMFSAPPLTSQPPPSTEETAADDEDEPPKVEVKQVQEDDAIYSKRCKLFYKKDDDYKEKGVGMLHLKTSGSGKTQLLVRADTNLGNILLNILLSKDIPTTRVGKNNVMLVCVPNPPIDTKGTTTGPTPMLIRVKTGEDADELKEKLDEYKLK